MPKRRISWGSVLACALILAVSVGGWMFVRQRAAAAEARKGGCEHYTMFDYAGYSSITELAQQAGTVIVGTAQTVSPSHTPPNPFPQELVTVDVTEVIVGNQDLNGTSVAVNQYPATVCAGKFELPRLMPEREYLLVLFPGDSGQPYSMPLGSQGTFAVLPDGSLANPQNALPDTIAEFGGSFTLDQIRTKLAGIQRH